MYEISRGVEVRVEYKYGKFLGMYIDYCDVLSKYRHSSLIDIIMSYFE